MLHRVLKRAGLPKVRFHDLRHTFATLALQNGVDIKTVSGMLGHYSAGFTLDTYAHVTTAAQKEAARALGKVLANALWKYPKTKRGPGAAEPHPDLAFVKRQPRAMPVAPKRLCLYVEKINLLR